MLVRWYHVGAFSPFLRAHAHIDTKRREPYLLAEPYKSHVRDTLRLRYSMLPIWYTAFRENSETGRPVVRHVFIVYLTYMRGSSFELGLTMLSSPRIRRASPSTTSSSLVVLVFSSSPSPAPASPRSRSISLRTRFTTTTSRPTPMSAPQLASTLPCLPLSTRFRSSSVAVPSCPRASARVALRHL
jgi:hypothetical protein